MNSIFYRPAWTCGRYNSQKRVALFYNLIEGISYFFEDDSADVINLILNAGKKGQFDINDLSNLLDISVDSLLPFVNQLRECNLLVDNLPDNKEIEQYRMQVRLNKKAPVKPTNDSYIIGMDSEAEDAYYSAVYNDTSIVWATLELTYRCNEKCIHCYNIGATRNDKEVSTRNKVKELDQSAIFRIIDELYSMGTVSVALTGGDPFSRSDIWEILDYLYEKDFAITILTNGYYLSKPTLAAKLANYYPKKVQISLYSSDPTIHDSITRVSGSFNKTIYTIDVLAKAAVPVIVACCVMKPNLKTYQKVKLLTDKLNVPISYELNITDSIDGDACPSRCLRLDEEKYSLVIQDSNFPLSINSHDESTMKKTTFSSTENFCGAGYGAFAITPDGFLIPCSAFHLALGDVKRQSLNEILISSSLLKDWKRTTAKDYQECGTHDYCFYCYPCPGNNYSNTGSYLKAGENNCFQAKCRFDVVKRINNGKQSLNREEIDEMIQKENDYSFPVLFRISGKEGSPQ